MAKQQTNQQQVKATARQSNWGYVNITTPTSYVTANVTFPVPFLAVPKSVIVTMTGYRNTASGAPASLADFNNGYGAGYSQTPFVTSVTTTGFTLYISAGTSNNIGASYIGYSWSAEAA